MIDSKLKNKNVIITVTNPLFHDRRMMRIASALAEEGARVLLVGVRIDNVPDPKLSGIEYKLLKIAAKKGFLFYAFYNIRLFFFLLMRSFDLLISVDLDSLPAGCLAAGIKGRKRIYDAHEYFTEVPELEGKAFVKWVWSSVAKLCIGKYNITVSESLAKVLAEKYCKDFELIRNLPDAMLLNHNPKVLPKDGPIRLLYIGYLNEGRGLEVLIEAMKSQPDRYELALAGSGDIENDLRKLIVEYDLRKRVHITGWLNPVELKPYLKKAHIGFNLLEKRSLSYYYSLANKTFDYMHYGIPAMHMAFPEYKKLNKKYNGFYLLEELEVNKLADLINNIAKDSDTYKRKSENNLLASNELTWEAEKGKLLSFIALCF